MHDIDMIRTQMKQKPSVSGRIAFSILVACGLSGCAGLDKTGLSACMPLMAAEGESALCASPSSDMALTTGSITPETTRTSLRLPFESVVDPQAEPLPVDSDVISDAVSIETVSRSAVLAKVATASVDFPAKVAPRGAPAALMEPPLPVSGKPAKMAPGSKARAGQSLSLNDAVVVAVLSHPLMGAQAAKIHSTLADVRSADAAQKPSLEIFGGTGQNSIGSYSNYPTQFDSAKIPGKSRTDAGFTFKQLIYDFGAARSEIERNQALVAAERLKLADQAEDIALRTVNSYLNLLEQQELLGIIDRTVSQQRALAGLVTLSQESGNGTKADVDRIQAKVIETEAVRSDINTAYRVSLDEFLRLTSLQPTRVHRPKSMKAMIPKTVEEAIAVAQRTNHSLLALRTTSEAYDHQIAGLKAQNMPKLDFQSDALVKHYMTGKEARQGSVDMRAMMTLSYKIFDGGLLEAQTDRIRSNQNANSFKALDERETVALNLRRFYLTLAASRTKRDAATRGLATANSANALYIEQFKAGKRTVFEVLDSNMMIFTMHRTRVGGEYEELRSIYGIMRNTGRLCENIAK